jgi:ATP-dependent phosphoenolpyruvate carboxykinase
MHEAGSFKIACIAEGCGLRDLKTISYHLEAPSLVEDAIRQGEALVAKGSALSAETGVHTGARQTTNSPCATLSLSQRCGGTTTNH